MSVYQENSFENRQEYLKVLAEEYGVDLETVKLLADTLGPDEDFDGLVSNLQDL